MANRQLFIDTETTGLSPNSGHRIVELAAVEAIDGKLTGRKFHTYLNPGRDIDPYAQKVHGLSSEFLADKPRFSEVSKEFINFLQGAECLMHNATFDTGFINAELTSARVGELLHHVPKVICTVNLAKSHFPGESASLDSLIAKAGLLCTRSNHSALEDATLLANIYFKLFAAVPATFKAEKPKTTDMLLLPDLLPFVAKHAEHYLTIHRVDATETYNYRVPEFVEVQVVDHSRHAKKCGKGETWMYIAVPRGANLTSLRKEQKLYVGSQTSDRMFRGDGPRVENFHHAQMRKGKGSSNLISFLQTGNEVDIYRFAGAAMRETVSSVNALNQLSALIQQPLPPRTHLSWWFEQYVLHKELDQWQWNRKGADAVVSNFLTKVMVV